MSRRRGEPVRHTCPDINRLIKTISSIVQGMDQTDSEDGIDAVLENINDWKQDLESIGVGHRCELEDLRNSNSALRDWGQDMYNEAESLEKERDELESKANDLEREINSLELTIERLERQLENLQEVIE